MKRFENIVQSKTEPNTNSLWIKDNVLKYFNNDQWVPLSYQEKDSNNNGVIDNLKEILDFLEGFDDDGTLKDFIEFQITDIRNRLSKAEDDVNKLEEQKDSMKTTINAHESSINTLEQNVSNLTTQVDSIKPYTLPVATKTTLGGIKNGISSIASDFTGYEVLHIDATDGSTYIVVKKRFNVSNSTALYRETPFVSGSNTDRDSNGNPRGLIIDSTLYTFNGDRAISSTATNFVLEKGLYSVINPINNSITTLTANLSNLTDAVEGLSTTVDGIQPDTLPTNSDFITALVAQLKNNSEFKAAVKQIMDENTAPTNEGQ